MYFIFSERTLKLNKTDKNQVLNKKEKMKDIKIFF